MFRRAVSSILRAAESDAPKAIPEKLEFSLVCPHETVMKKQVDMITVPGVSGSFGVLPGHIPTVTSLQPGVVAVQDGSETHNYFVSGGFAFINKDFTANICALEACKVEDLDTQSVKEGLEEFTKLLGSATEEKDVAVVSS
mmetsp:Transcript_19492/g.49940  ORF Transcript_19492/g.49940 Transcript_19492/m.49940 type:complete len:141 (-) Transcript_19492:495-917(-)